LLEDSTTSCGTAGYSRTARSSTARADDLRALVGNIGFLLEDSAASCSTAGYSRTARSSTASADDLRLLFSDICFLSKSQRLSRQ
jgi:hypothetical protein